MFEEQTMYMIIFNELRNTMNNDMYMYSIQENIDGILYKNLIQYYTGHPEYTHTKESFYGALCSYICGMANNKAISNFIINNSGNADRLLDYLDKGFHRIVADWLERTFNRLNIIKVIDSHPDATRIFISSNGVASSLDMSRILSNIEIAYENVLVPLDMDYLKQNLIDVHGIDIDNRPMYSDRNEDGSFN